MKVKVLFLFGTRPEAIKLCPVVGLMKSRPEAFAVRVAVTAQHRGMLDQVLDAFAVRPEVDLDIMRPGQTLFQSTARIIAGLEPVFDLARPDLVLVQGDTTTTFCGALGAFYAGIPVGHVEAGLRTGDMREPFPEEMNRVLTGRIAAYHFAATKRAAQNLFDEGVDPASVAITGNTSIDAVLEVKAGLDSGRLSGFDGFIPDPEKKLILVTAHRRENFGPGLEQICVALARIARRGDIQIVYPVHPNPHVANAARRHLGGRPNIVLLEPLDYVPFVDLMGRAHLVLTDSGGIQEEAPSLGKPVLVMRNKTERMEAVEAGTAKLVGTDARAIVNAVEHLLEDPLAYEQMARTHNPYGDGHASQRIAAFLAARFVPELEAVMA